MTQKRRRRLRRLVPDVELIRRRAAGEPFRSIGPDYEVSHTTLVRYFARPEVAKQVKDMEKQLRAEERARLARRSAERQLERDVCSKARAQAARENAVRLAQTSPPRATRRVHHDPDAAWLDERDAARPLTREEMYSQNDRTAADDVAAGGGIEAVIAATGLRTLDNVVRLIDPEILTRAFDNDLLAGPATYRLRLDARRSSASRPTVVD